MSTVALSSTVPSAFTADENTPNGIYIGNNRMVVVGGTVADRKLMEVNASGVVNMVNAVDYAYQIRELSAIDAIEILG